jgi:hypothetical protein
LRRSRGALAPWPIAELQLELDADAEIPLALFLEKLARPVQPSQQFDE